MKIDNKILKTITGRFPNHQEIIKELFAESDSFYSLCKDYYDCKNVLETLNCPKKREEIIRMEYEVILLEIEEELTKRIICDQE